MNRVAMVEEFLLSLERERTRLNLTQKQMAKHLEITHDQYRKLIAGDRQKIDLYTAYRLHKLTGKSIGELCGDHDKAPSLYTKLAQLSERQLLFIGNVIEFELEMSHQISPDINLISCLVPTGNLEDGMVWDSCSVEKVDAGEYVKRYPQLSCGIKVTSNHMHPVYVNGDVLLIARQPPRDGDTAVLVNRSSGRAYLRKFRQGHPCSMEPINGYGATFYVNPDDPVDMGQWIKFGVVISKMR